MRVAFVANSVSGREEYSVSGRCEVRVPTQRAQRLVAGWEATCDAQRRDTAMMEVGRGRITF